MKYELYEVRSGGQTGADTAGVLAARFCGIPTGGVMPKGWRTLEGPKPHYEQLFGMREHYLSAYAPRTSLNVKESDATIRFATDFKSAGERCTLRAIKDYGKPYFDVDPSDPPTTDETVAWIVENNVRRLNVAGNSSQTSPKIAVFTFNYLIEVFGELGYPILADATEVLIKLSS